MSEEGMMQMKVFALARMELHAYTTEMYPKYQ